VKAVSGLRLTIAVLITFTSACVFSQTISAYKSQGKWGFKKGETTIIDPQYDSVFGFDPKGKICLVGNIDPLKRSVNSLTKEVKIAYAFRYINDKNERLYFKAPNGLDSTSEATPTKYAGALYKTDGDLIIACVSGKKILATKKGKQISRDGYDNIIYTKVPGFLLCENKSGRSLFGLMTTEAEIIIPPVYSKISFNTDDSLIYCCTAGSKFNGMDDIYDYKGKKIHSSNKHIQGVSKNYYIYKLYASENSFIVYDVKENKERNLKAEYIYYLKDDKAALLDDDWFFYDLKTDKRTPMDKSLIKYMKLDE
jgi:hypothetical protein